MFLHKKPLPDDDQPELLGLNLKVNLAEYLVLRLRLSEKAVLELKPLLIVFAILAIGWIGFNQIPKLPPAPPPTADVQPRK